MDIDMIEVYPGVGIMSLRFIWYNFLTYHMGLTPPVIISTVVMPLPPVTCGLKLMSRSSLLPKGLGIECRPIHSRIHGRWVQWL